MKEVSFEDPEYKCAFCQKELSVRDEAFSLEHKGEGIVPLMFAGRFCSAEHLLRYVMNEVVARLIANGMPPIQARQVISEQLAKDPLIN